MDKGTVTEARKPTLWRKCKRTNNGIEEQLVTLGFASEQLRLMDTGNQGCRDILYKLDILILSYSRTYFFVGGPILPGWVHYFIFIESNYM